MENQAFPVLSYLVFLVFPGSFCGGSSILVKRFSAGRELSLFNSQGNLRDSRISAVSASFYMQDRGI